jgi:Ni/Co efflux regulator RcnB
MKSLSTVSLVLALGLAGTALQARDDRPGRGADYSESNSSRQESNRGRGDDAVHGDVGSRTSGVSDGGRGDFGRSEGGGGRGSFGRGEGEGSRRDFSRGDGSGGRGGYERGESRGDFRHSEGGRGDRDLNTRIAGWQGGHREPERFGGAQPRHEDRGYREDWRHDGRGSLGRREDRHWRNEDYRSSGRHYNDPRRDSRWDDRHHYDHGRDGRRDWRHPDWRRHWSHGWSGDRYRAPVRYVYPRGYRAHSWRIGYRLPPVFIVSNWYVDWRYYRLAAPPWGCRWLRVDGDLLLIDERSGEIVDALYGFFYY